MDSLIFELQIVFYFQLFLSANVRHTPQSPEILCCRIQFSFSITDRPGQVPNAFGYIYIVTLKFM